MIDVYGNEMYSITCDACGHESDYVDEKELIYEELKTSFWHKAIKDSREVDVCNQCHWIIKNFKVEGVE